MHSKLDKITADTPITELGQLRGAFQAQVQFLSILGSTVPFKPSAKYLQIAGEFYRANGGITKVIIDKCGS